MSDRSEADDLRLLGARARQSKRKMLVLGVIMLSVGGFLASSGVLVAGPGGGRALCVLFGGLLVAMGGFLVGVARRSSARLLELAPRIARGEGVVWVYVDSREVGGGSELLHLIGDDGLEHVMVLPSPEVHELVTLVRRRVPAARFGEDPRLRERYEQDRAGVARELSSSPSA